MRRCTQSKNQANQGLRITNTSGRKGVIFQKGSGRWRAQITYQGQQIYLGSYPDRDEAAAAYQRAADGLFPGFALKMVYRADEAYRLGMLEKELQKVVDTGSVG